MDSRIRRNDSARFTCHTRRVSVIPGAYVSYPAVSFIPGPYLSYPATTGYPSPPKPWTPDQVGGDKNGVLSCPTIICHTRPISVIPSPYPSYPARICHTRPISVIPGPYPSYPAHIRHTRLDRVSILLRHTRLDRVSTTAEAPDPRSGRGGRRWGLCRLNRICHALPASFMQCPRLSFLSHVQSTGEKKAPLAWRFGTCD
jgi:hypothetical protein